MTITLNQNEADYFILYKGLSHVTLSYNNHCRTLLESKTVNTADNHTLHKGLHYVTVVQ